MPRRRRVVGPGESFYHITTRIVDKEKRFTYEENVRNLNILRRVEDFSGVQIIAYCFMSNHVHILLRVPVRKEISQKELLRRIEVLYGKGKRDKLEARWMWYKEHGREEYAEDEQKPYLVRMYDMGEFMKTFKQRLTMSYNARNNRSGTFWESRYYSDLLEATPHVLSAVAAYIDRNPVRAGLVDVPEEYVFSSFAEACAGGEKAQAGLCRIYQEDGQMPEWNEIQESYRMRIQPSESAVAASPDDVYREITQNEWLGRLLGGTPPPICRGFAIGCVEFRKRVEKYCCRRWASQKVLR